MGGAPLAPGPPRSVPVSGLLVTADDLGLRESVDLGIVRAYRGGAVTHASWLAGGDSSRECVSTVRDNAPGLGVGLHLSLSQTRPSSDALSPLVREGRFPSRQFTAIRWAWGRAERLRAVAAEWEAQADAFEAVWGRAPSHLDGHQHGHLAPPFAPLAVALAVRRGIPRIRAPRGGSPGRGLRGRAEAAAFYRLGARLALLAEAAGLTVPDLFDGFHASGHLTVRDLRLMETRRRGLTEWMVHPGLRDEPGGYDRRQELDALLAHARSE